MAKQGQNEGVRVLDDFVCEAIYASDAPCADERRQGRNEGMRVLEELVFEIPGEEETPKAAASESPASSSNLDPSMQRLADELAVVVARQADPVGVMTLFQQKVIAQVNAIQDSAKASRKQPDPVED